MKKWYFLEGIEKIGPLNVDELISGEVRQSTLVWSEGMEDWKRLDEVNELYEKFKLKIPPEIPTSLIAIKNRQKLIHKRALNLFIGWILLHFFLGLMSYCGLDYFNGGRDYRKDKFWPFVRFDFEGYDSTGIAVNYDYTEFIFYVALGIILFIWFKRWSK